MDETAANGHLEVVKFVHYNCCQGCTTEAMDHAAARHGHLEIVKFLHFNRTEGCTARAMVLAIARGFYEVVEFLSEHRTECDVVTALKEAVVSCRLEIVKLLCAKLEPGQSAYPAMEAASQGWNKSEIAKYLCEHVDHGPARFLVQAVDNTVYNVVHAVWKYSSLEELIHAEKHALEQDKPEIAAIIADGVRIKTHAS